MGIQPFTPVMDRFHLSRAESLLREGKLERAAHHIGCVRADGVGILSHTWRLKGRLLSKAGRPLAAIRSLQTATRLPGATYGCVLELAYVLARAREFTDAERILERYLGRRPGDRRAVRLLAHLYRAQGRFSTALEILRSRRPKSVAGKYAPIIPPAPVLARRPVDSWHDALGRHGKGDHCWRDPAGMALDRDLRDDLLCFFDDLLRAGDRKALAHGVARALESDQSWLMPWLRKVDAYLKLEVPADLPMFVARHGARRDRGILLAGLAQGGRVRVLSAAALISLGFAEYEEVLLEMRESKRAEPVPVEVWSAARALLNPVS